MGQLFPASFWLLSIDPVTHNRPVSSRDPRVITTVFHFILLCLLFFLFSPSSLPATASEVVLGHSGGAGWGRTNGVGGEEEGGG